MHTDFTPDTLRRDLAHVYWMGGSPCSGKSSIASILTARYGFQPYTCDDAFFHHVKMADPTAQPVLYRIDRMNWEQIWMRPVAEQVEDELAAYREQFPFILSDLLALPKSRPVLVEGAALLPELIAPLVGTDRRAVWVVPSPEFQLYHYSRREFIKGILSECSDPAQAFENWMQRDIGFAHRVRQDAESLGFPALVVDGTTTLDQNARTIEHTFDLPSGLV